MGSMAVVNRSVAALLLGLGAAALVMTTSTSLAAAPVPASNLVLAGQWTLNRDLSEFPAEVGFGLEPTGPATSTQRAGGGGGGGGRGGGGGSRGGRSGGGAQSGGSSYNVTPALLSPDAAKQIAELIDDAKEPSPTLTITQTDTAVTVVDARDHTRRFHPNGKEDIEQLEAGPVGATSKWNGQQLVVDVTIAKDRMFRYVYSKRPDGKLVVETRLEDKPGHDAGNVITRVYDGSK
jgi:hypothetical protein